MFIKKIAQNNAFDTDIKNERIMSLFKQKADSGQIYWKPNNPYKDTNGDVIYSYLGYVLLQGHKSPNPNQIYSFNLSVMFSGDWHGTYESYIDLYLNKSRGVSGVGEENIGSWVFRDVRTIETLLKPFLKAEFGVDMLRLPKEEEAYKQKQQSLSGMGTIKKNIAGKGVIEGIRLTRHKSSDFGDAKSFEVYVYPVEAPFQGEKIFVTAYKIKNLERQSDEGEKVKFSGDLEQSIDQMNELISRAKANKYVDETSTLVPYIPSNATPINYDFVLRRFKEGEVSNEGADENRIENQDPPQININTFGGTNKDIKIAQNFEGYYSGDVPNYAVQNLGTGAVDASQVSSMFGKADDAIRLVNEFNSSLLSTVSFIFNFSKGGAYGVYLSELDRAIKTKALQRKLEASGYRVENEDGMLRAYPTKEEKSSEQIQQDIDTIYADLESKGGTAFGINMNSVLNAAKQDAMSAQSEDPNIWEWMAMLHLGGTIVHEAVHAKGNHDEGPSENAEAAFTSWALPKINQQYMQSLETQGKGEMFAPIIIGTGTRSAAKQVTWYKKAQYSNYAPQALNGGKATGSDLSGRAGEYKPQEGMADWGLLAQQDQNIPLEEKLGRGFMSPIPQDLDQEHDSYEEQLRKYTREDERHAHDATMEDLLSRDYDDENTPYKSIEELLDERRPKPLMIPLDRTASNNMIKTATLFGWMNNLEISDGSTIPGLSDRVMPWEDGEEDFAWTEKDIRSQPRYNPEYDIKGFYYRWIDPRLKPQLFDDMTRDYSGTHPAKRFASEGKNVSLTKVFNILTVAKRKVARGNIHATRFVMSEDILKLVEDVLESNSDVSLMVKYIREDKNTNDDVYAVWIYSKGISESKVRMAEDIFSKGGDVDEDMFEELFNVKSKKEQTIKTIITNAKKICKEYSIEDVYLVGGYPRAIAAGEPIYTVEDLDFSGAWPNQSIKVGGLLAERLGVKNAQIYHRTMTLSFVYKGIKVDFKGNFSPIEIRKQMRDNDIATTPLNMDIYNRDFTVNMLVYDINKDEVFDISGESIKNLNSKIIRTYFDPDYICRQNPLIIMRALKFKMRGYKIDPDLERAMIMNSPLLFDGRYSDSRILMARGVIEEGGSDLADELFNEYGLDKIKEY